MSHYNDPNLKLTSHRIETNTKAPITVHELTIDKNTSWLVDHRSHALRSERADTPWDASKEGWADISPIEENKALFQTIAKAHQETGKRIFGKDESAWKSNFDFDNIASSTRTQLLKMKEISEATTQDDNLKVAFTDPKELSDFLKSTYETPKSASHALISGSLRGKETYEFSPADLKDLTPNWSVKTEHSMAPHLPTAYNIQQVILKPDGLEKLKTPQKPSTVQSGNMRLGVEMLETGGDTFNRNATLSLGSQVIAANYVVSPNTRNANGIPEGFKRHTKRTSNFEEFRKADGLRSLAVLAEDKNTTPLGRFAETQEIVASLTDKRSPEGREWNAWAASSRWAVNSKHNDQVVNAQRDRMLKMAGSHPDANLGKAISLVANSIEGVEPHSKKRHQVQDTARD